MALLTLSLVAFQSALSEQEQPCIPETPGDCEAEETDLVRVSLLQTRLTPPERPVLLEAKQAPGEAWNSAESVDAWSRPGGGGVHQWRDGALANPSSAPLMTFYIYRAVNGEGYQPLNVNAGNLAGVLWYLQNEVEVTPWAPKFWINKIERYTFRYRPSQPLANLGMHFGVRYSFDSGLCTGPFDCNAQFKKYGYFLGCNYLGHWPFPEFKTGYPTGIWYSIPGECPSRKFNSHGNGCQNSEPGGFCSGIPTGRGDCMFSFEKSGEIMISELEGSKGHGFWNNVYDDRACAARVAAAEELFRKKYPSSPNYPTPPCDFVRERFYNEGYPPKV